MGFVKYCSEMPCSGTSPTLEISTSFPENFSFHRSCIYKALKTVNKIVVTYQEIEMLSFLPVLLKR
jgi:hypothetical protein